MTRHLDKLIVDERGVLVMRAKKDINTEVGIHIQIARERAGYTQEKLSEMLNLSPNHLSAIERGVSGVSLDVLKRLCRLLGVSADYIIFGEENPCDDTYNLALQLAKADKRLQPQTQKILAAMLELSALYESSAK